MYEFQCLTVNDAQLAVDTEACMPFYGECYPVGEGCCGPDCSPN